MSMPLIGVGPGCNSPNLTIWLMARIASTLCDHAAALVLQGAQHGGVHAAQCLACVLAGLLLVTRFMALFIYNTWRQQGTSGGLETGSY